MTVRAKFKVQSINKSDDGTATINLLPVIFGSEENEKFFKYTPDGSISLSTINPDAADQFEVDGEYYVDFTSATPAENSEAA